MDRRKRTVRTVALMSLFSMTDTQENVPVASFYGDGSDIISLIVGIEPVQAGSGDPSPDNVRPISGWTQCKVTRTGKNLLATIPENTGSVITSIDAHTGVVSVADISTAQWSAKPFAYSDVKAGQIYTFSASLTYGRIGGSISATGYPSEANTPDTSIGENIRSVLSKAFAQRTFTANKTERIYWYYCTDISIADHVAFSFTPQFELGSTASSYEPYQGETYSIAFPSSAGTVYGGTLDVTSGKLTVDRAMLGNVTWTKHDSYSHVFFASVGTGQLVNSTTSVSNLCVLYSGGNLSSFASNSEYRFRISDRIYINIPSVSNVTDLNTWITNNSLQICYELATPIVYDLTPTQVTTLIGTNNIWADTGDIKYIEYNI